MSERLPLLILFLATLTRAQFSLALWHLESVGSSRTFPVVACGVLVGCCCEGGSGLAPCTSEALSLVVGRSPPFSVIDGAGVLEVVSGSASGLAVDFFSLGSAVTHG